MRDAISSSPSLNCQTETKTKSVSERNFLDQKTNRALGAPRHFGSGASENSKFECISWMHQNPKSFGCIENSIFIFMAFFLKTVEVGNTVLDQSKILAQKALSLGTRIDQLVQAKNRYLKGHFSHKKGTGSSPSKNSSTSKQSHSIPRARKGDQIELFFDILRHFFPQISLALPIIKPGAKKGIYCENRQKSVHPVGDLKLVSIFKSFSEPGQ